MPALVWTLHVKLDKGARKLFIFPGRSRLARTQPDDCVIRVDGLAGLESQIARDSIPLVEKAEDCDPIRHRSNAGLLTRTGIGSRKPRAIGLLRFVIAPASRQEQQCRAGNGENFHLSPESTAGSRPSRRAGTYPTKATRQGGTPP